MRNTFLEKVIQLIIKAIVFLVALVFLVPVLLTILESFRNDGSISLTGYNQLFFNCFTFYRLFWNSVIYSALISVGAILISVPAAFAFKFARFKGKGILFVIYIILMMMPLQVMLLPNYIGLRDMGILYKPMAIILPLVFSPFAVVVTHQYMREIDSSIIESARLETNSAFKIILHCVVPQIKVCIAAVALFVYADMWNMVEQPMLYLDNDKLRTLSTFIVQADQYDASVMLPASVMFMVPVFLFYLLFHEELKQGLKL
ncbi:MAG: carbohydrate ABC transporter permease [Clostridiales bacterium]|nr:carbohydrate ABC transporter permease [Clostridiales bacterium]